MGVASRGGGGEWCAKELVARAGISSVVVLELVANGRSTTN